MHAIERARERYGIILWAKDLRKACNKIAQKKSLLMAKLPGRRERHLVKIRGKALLVIYDPICATIITILPHGRKPKHFYERARVKSRRRRR